MKQLSVIGNLGADAEVVNYQGQKFITLSVAHTQKWVDTTGKEQTTTEWVQCSLNISHEKMLPYLKKGRTVFVQGRETIRVYSSPKLRQFVGQSQLFVDRIELIGSRGDDVPRFLYTPDGEQVGINRMYYVAPDIARTLIPKGAKGVELLSRDASRYWLEAKTFFVTPVKPEPEETPTETNTPQEDGSSPSSQE